MRNVRVSDRFQTGLCSCPLLSDPFRKFLAVPLCPQVTYNALVDAMSRVGDVDRAADLFRDMCAQGLSPDLVTYSTVPPAALPGFSMEHFGCGNVSSDALQYPQHTSHSQPRKGKR